MLWQEGQLIYKGKYKIERYLGFGGFAVTYQAIHTSLNRRVVLKTPNTFVKGDPDYPKYIERFKKEARTLAQCCADAHPHIVQVFDFVEEDDCYYLEMQYIAGESLWNYVLSHGALSELEAVKYISQIGSALVEIHKKTIFHLDVTPYNIMLNFDGDFFQCGKAVLIDFGIAGDMSPPSSLSRTFGNQVFAPYELIRKGVRHPTVDVYCLAASLYYAITGKRPTNSMDRHDDEELKSPKELVPNLSDAVNEAILQGLALQAKDRPQTMQDWLNLLPNMSWKGDDAKIKTNPIELIPVKDQSHIQPSDWAFVTLKSLVERYGAITDDPNGRFKDDRSITRYEFAAGLNACLDRVNELIVTAQLNLVTKQDLANLQRLQEEFATELVTLFSMKGTDENYGFKLKEPSTNAQIKVQQELILMRLQEKSIRLRANLAELRSDESQDNLKPDRNQRLRSLQEEIRRLQDKYRNQQPGNQTLSLAIHESQKLQGNKLSKEIFASSSAPRPISIPPAYIKTNYVTRSFLEVSLNNATDKSVYASVDGVMKKVAWNRGGYGNLVEIRHADGSLTRCGHNSRILVQVGQQVRQGQQIAKIGSTGFITSPHTHFEIHSSEKGKVNPIAMLPSNRI
ncbi:iron uptake porin [Anabaena sp. CCY 9910]|uniref:iron uptake porin n=1 Tax=Anabaena sp. CCY 9910 TaxID=3103870 RepID=UPI0039E0EDAB